MSSASKAAVHLIIQGRVQGVGFRYFTLHEAQKLHLGGWVTNRPDGQVEAHAEGSRTDLELFIQHLRQGPPLSRVEDVRVSWELPEEISTTFIIK